jgi:hypothetical protein
MDTTNLAALPDAFSAGTTVSYLKSYSGDSNAQWTLHLYLAGVQALGFTGVAEGTGWRITIDPSAIEKAGTYRWVERLEKTSAVIDVASGLVIVTPDLAAAADGDLQSWAEKTLPIVELALSNRIPNGMESYQIAGRAISKIPISELMKIRAQLVTLIAQAQSPTRFSKPITVSFPGA